MTFVGATTVPLGMTTIPVQWITSGVVTPVAGFVSPAASIPTAWVAQPVVLEPNVTSVTSSPMLAAMQVATAPPLPPQPVTEVAAPPTQSDPTLTSSIASALAGYASATGAVVRKAVGAGAAGARRVGSELWAGVRNPRAVHVTQVPSKYNPSPAAGNRDCGPASVVMVLGLLDKNVPGTAAGASAQRRINRVRQLAGAGPNGQSTTNIQLEQALQAAGTSTREIADAASIKESVLAGNPVILNGNPRNTGAYGPKFSASQMAPYDGAHWIVVSGFDTKSGAFIINDPLSKIGAVKVTPAQLEGYRGGSLGIEVSAS